MAASEGHGCHVVKCKLTLCMLQQPLHATSGTHGSKLFVAIVVVTLFFVALRYLRLEATIAMSINKN